MTLLRCQLPPLTVMVLLTLEAANIKAKISKTVSPQDLSNSSLVTFDITHNVNEGINVRVELATLFTPGRPPQFEIIPKLTTDKTCFVLFLYVLRHYLDSHRTSLQAGSMGCGSSLDSRPGQDQQQAAMLCDMCNNKFSFISRKRTCCECGQQFCSSCLPRDTAGGKAAHMNIQLGGESADCLGVGC